LTNGRRKSRVPEKQKAANSAKLWRVERCKRPKRLTRWRVTIWNTSRRYRVQAAVSRKGGDCGVSIPPRDLSTARWYRPQTSRRDRVPLSAAKEKDRFRVLLPETCLSSGQARLRCRHNLPPYLQAGWPWGTGEDSTAPCTGDLADLPVSVALVAGLGARARGWTAPEGRKRSPCASRRTQSFLRKKNRNVRSEITASKRPQPANFSAVERKGTDTTGLNPTVPALLLCS
jgi:hypothetical protein